MPIPRHLVISRRSFIAGTALAGAGAWSVRGNAQKFFESQKSSDSGLVTIAMAGRASLCHLPMVIAEQLDYFRAEGLNTRFIDLNSTERVAQAVASGAAQFGAGTYDTTLLPSSGASLKSIVVEGRVPALSLGVSGKSIPNYRSIVDLYGRRVGVSATTNLSRAMVASALQKVGMPMSSVTLVPIPTMPVAITALRSREVDAICHVDPVMTMLEMQNDLRIVADARTLKGSIELFGGPMPSACVFANAEYIDKNPAQVQSVANGMVRSLKWLQTAEAGDMMKAVPENLWMGDKAMYLAAFEKARESISTDGAFDPEGGKIALRVSSLLEPGRAEQSQPNQNALIARSFTNDFVKRAKEKFKIA